MKIHFSLTLFFLSACCIAQINSTGIEGCWSSVLKDSSYCETYITPEKIIINWDDQGLSGRYSYKIIGDSIFFLYWAYKIDLKNCNKMIWKNNSVVMEMEKTFFLENDESPNKIDPYYLRRCYFLVSKGFMDMKSAIKYLTEVAKESIRVEEIIIPIKKN